MVVDAYHFFVLPYLLLEPTWRWKSLCLRTRLVNMLTRSSSTLTPVWRSSAGCSSYKIWLTLWRFASHVKQIGVCLLTPLRREVLHLKPQLHFVSVCCSDVAADLRGRSLQRPDTAHPRWGHPDLKRLTQLSICAKISGTAVDSHFPSEV